MKSVLPLFTLAAFLAASSLHSAFAQEPAAEETTDEKKSGEDTDKGKDKKGDKAGDEKPRSPQDRDRIKARNDRKAQEAWMRDQKKRNAKDYAEMETQYQEINKKFKSPEVKNLLEAFIKKWKNGNRVGCATMYLAQKSSGPEREKLLEKCIKDYSDAYYLNGCSVGGLSRLFLAHHYEQSGKKSKAKKLAEEIQKSYADAEDHSGNLVIDQLGDLAKK